MKEQTEDPTTKKASNETDENKNEQPPPMDPKITSFFNNVFDRISFDVNDALKTAIETILELNKSDFGKNIELANSIVLMCTNRNFVDNLSYDQLYILAKLLMSLENHKLITFNDLMEFCYEIFSIPINISYAMVDVILYTMKERVIKNKELCLKFTECIYFAELTPLLSVYLEFGAIGEEPNLDITAYDPVPELYKSPECVRLNAEKAVAYGPSVSEMEEFTKIDIGRIVIHVNDSNMKNYLQIIEGNKIDELPNDLKNDIRFILNSSTMANIQQKSQELANRVQMHYYSALSHFLVNSISNMSVNVDVISNIWLRLELSIFYPLFISDFCNMVKKMFMVCHERSENVQTFFVLGNIFGEVTLNRNFPIIDSNIDLKYLLIEAFFKRTTIHHALVFVSRTLIRAKQSQFFRTHNYFILQILSVMKEIYLKLCIERKTQLPIEIQQTFRELGIDVSNIRPSCYLEHPGYIMILPLTFYWSDVQALRLLHQYIYLTAFNHAVNPCVYQSIKYRDIEHVDVSRMLAFFNISFNASFPKALSAKVAIHYAIETTYNEYANSVSERVNRGCLNLCETLILKDFPQDQYDDMMRRSVIDMARSIATSYSYTILHGNLYPNLIKSFRQNIHEILLSTTHGSVSTPYNVRECTDNLAADNVDLLINLIQKFCGEKLLSELVKRISISLESRSNCIPLEKSMRLTAYSDAQKKLCPKLKVNFNTMSPEHKFCYSKYVNYQPGFMPDISTMDHLLESVVTISNERREQLEIISINIEQIIDAFRSHMNNISDEHLIRELTTLKEMIKYLLESRLGRVIVAIIKHLIMTNFYLFGNCLNSQVAIHLRVIVYFREILDIFRYWDGIGPYRLAKFVTRVVMEVPQTLQFSNETVFHLVRNFLIIVSDYDIFLAKCIDNAKNGPALRFAMLFCKTFLVNEKQYNITNDNLKLTLSTLQYLTTVKNDTNTSNLGENLKSPLSFATKSIDPSIIFPGIDLQSLPNQLANFKSHVDHDRWLGKLFVTWLTHYYDDPIKHLDPNYISAIRKAFEIGGFTPSVDYWKEFVKCCLKFGFKECLREDLDNKFICRLCDSMTGFCSLIIKSIYEFSNIGNVAAITQLFMEIGNCLVSIIETCTDVSKIGIVRRFLSSFCLELRRPFLNDEGDSIKEQPVDMSTAQSEFAGNKQNNNVESDKEKNTIPQKPDGQGIDYNFEHTNDIRCAPSHGLFQLMHSYANLLHIIRPNRFPKFAAHWQKVVINTYVIPTLITGGTDKSGWLACNAIIIDMLLFLGAIIRQGVLAPHRVRYFEEALNFFHSLKEDFPTVMANYFITYVGLLPINAIQMRNIFLCASPIPVDSMPNPFRSRLNKLTQYDFICPKLMFDAMVYLEPKSIHDELLKYFVDGVDDKVLDKIYTVLVKNTTINSGEVSINTAALHSMIFLCGYFGTQGKSTKESPRKIISIQSVQTGVPFYIIAYLLSVFDSKNQYLIIGSMANHLRYPNAHTRFFRCVFMALAIRLCEPIVGGDEGDDGVLQLIIRTLTERLLPRPPHPWGVIATLAELLTETSMDIMSKNFITENKDILSLLNGIREKALE